MEASSSTPLSLTPHCHVELAREPTFADLRRRIDFLVDWSFPFAQFKKIQMTILFETGTSDDKLRFSLSQNGGKKHFSATAFYRSIFDDKSTIFFA